MAVKKLTPKQLAFVEEYLINGLNGKQAYMKVYGVKNERSAETAGNRLLQNVEVATIIQQKQQKDSEATGITREWILKEQERVYNYALNAMAITSSGEAVPKMDLSNANKAIDQLAKLVGAYSPDQWQMLGKDGKPINPIGPTIINKTYLQKPNVSPNS